MARRRGFGELERRTGPTGPSYRARYAMPDGSRHSRNFRTKMDAEAWLAREREQAMSTVQKYAERYVAERGLRPTTVRGYEALLATWILPYFGAMPLRD